MSTALPPRSEDIFRHLEDLRTRSYEGVHDWEGKLDLFRRAMALLDPVVRRIMDETNRTFLDDTGGVNHRVGEDRDGGAWAHWELSWPAQREATARDGGRVQPIQVIATFPRGAPHPHLSASIGGMWPCQITDEADAGRQEPVIGAIVETELHQRIFDGRWQVIPAFTRRHEPA
ncbi:MAG: hypothetical protein GEV03_24345 [Streptosporangiales bacterium]|nr:hypothetical protein [Streptosporangiales bacterium]